MNKITFEAKDLLLSNVPEHKKFVCINSGIFVNVEELALALKLMSQEVFDYHVNSEKNDFSNWVYDIIGDARLAENLRETNDPKIAAKEIKTRIIYLKRNTNNCT